MPKKQKLISPLEKFIQETESTIIWNIQTLKSQLNKYSETYWANCECVSYEHAKLFFKWTIEFYENFELMLQGSKPFDQPNPEELYLLSDWSLILKSINLNSYIENQVWEPVILPSFGSTAMKESENNRQNILRTVIKLIGGYLNESRVIEQIGGDSLEFRTMKVEGSNPEKWILFSLEINRFPIVLDELIDGFNYVQLLKIIDISENNAKSIRLASSYLQKIKDEPELWVLKNDIESLIVNNAYIDDSKTIAANYNTEKLRPEERSLYKYLPNIKRWRKGQKQKEKSETPKVTNAISQANQQILSQIANPASCAQFIKVMEMLKSFKFRLSEEERSIVSESSNLLTIGRSGTGKTTSSILRMFATEVVFKKKSKMHMHQSGLLSTNSLTEDDVVKKVNLHQIFITVSPVLIYEVNRLYEDLKKQLNCAIKRIEYQKGQEDDLEDHFFNQNEESDTNLPKSLLDFEDRNFPVFISVSNLMTRIDATFENPFFAQGEENIEQNFAYDQQRKGMKMKYFEVANGYELKSTFEVDFEYFDQNFWPRVRNLIGVSSIMMWTEISSVIKGSSDAYKSEEGHINRNIYLSLGKKQSQIESTKREKAWDIFVQYEAWKKRQNAYDFQDLVNYALKCIEYEGYRGSPIHFTFIDEVQDCSNSFLLLIIKLTELKLFFAGDTAQSITRGAGFRFCDLNSLFLETSVMNHSKPVIKYLSVNFRSHTEILEVAHVVIQLMLAFFPDYVDRLEKETSPYHGPQPVIIKSKSVEQLSLCIKKISKRSSNCELGCDQVVLVRTPEAREKLKRLLKGVVCLTILESKGLEFDNVILYNFFADSEVEENEWSRLSKFLTKDPGEIKKAREGMKSSLLCSELKHLYVGITRTRNNLMIFDEDDSCRASLQKCWEAEDLIEIFDYDSMSPGEIAEIQNDRTDVGNFNLWKRQGMKLLNRKNYEEAKTYFERSGDQNLVKKIDAIIIAEKAKRIRLEISSLEDEAKETGIKLTKPQKEENKRKIAETKTSFMNAAAAFEEIGDYREAALCYSSSESYENAARLFSKLNMCQEAGLSFYKLKRYSEAAEFYQYTKDYGMHIKCCVLSEKFDEALDAIQQNISKIEVKEARSLLQSMVRGSVSRYFPEPFLDKNKDNWKFLKLYDSFTASESDFNTYLENSKNLDEFVQLSKEFYERRSVSANNTLDSKTLFMILKHVGTILHSLKQRTGKTVLYNQGTIDFIRSCQSELPEFFDLFSEKFDLDPLVPLSLLLDAFKDLHTRICMLIANSLRLADLSCWYMVSFIFKLSRPLIPINEFKAGSYLRYRSVLTALMFLDESFYEREVLGYSLATAGFWKILRLIPEKDCKNLMRLYFLDSYEYNKLSEDDYFTELKSIKILEQLMIMMNLDINYTLKGVYRNMNFSSQGFYKNLYLMSFYGQNYDFTKLINWIRSFILGESNVFNGFFQSKDSKNLKAIESCAALSLLMMSSKEVPIYEIKKGFDVSEMDAFIITVENVIKLLLGHKNSIELSKRSFVLEYLLLPLGISPIAPGKYTRLLPFSTHVVMSKYYIRSELILAKENSSIYSFDIDENYFLVPKDIIFKDIAKTILHCLSELIYERSQYRIIGEDGKEIEPIVSQCNERQLAKKIEYKICILGEIHMLNKLIKMFNTCGETYESKFGDVTSSSFIFHIKVWLGNLPFPCINITTAAKEALAQEAVRILNDGVYNEYRAFRQLRTALLFLILAGEENIFFTHVRKWQLSYQIPKWIANDMIQEIVDESVKNEISLFISKSIYHDILDELLSTKKNGVNVDYLTRKAIYEVQKNPFFGMFERYRYFLEKKPKNKQRNKVMRYEERTDIWNKIIDMALGLRHLYTEARQGKADSVCRDIYRLFANYKQYIPQQEISNLFQMYCAYALLTCTYSYIPSTYEKPYLYYYHPWIYNNIQKYIKDPQDPRVVTQNISIMQTLIDMFRGKKDCLSKLFDEEDNSKMYNQTLTVIINSTKSGEYFRKLTDLDLRHKYKIYNNEKKLKEIFDNRYFDFPELQYLYNHPYRIAQLINNSGSDYIIGADLLKFCDFLTRESKSESIYESLPYADFKKFTKYKDIVENLWPDIISMCKQVLDKRSQEGVSDVVTIQNLIKVVNEANEVFMILYDNDFAEESYTDSILEEINELSQFYMQQDESLQSQPIRSSQNLNRDDQDRNESDSEEETETIRVKILIEDPIDKVKFNEDNIKIDEEAELQDKFVSIRDQEELKNEVNEDW